MRRILIAAAIPAVLAACNTQQSGPPSGPSTEFQPGDAEEHAPGVEGEVRTVTLPDPDGEPVTFSYEIIDGLAIFEGDMIIGSAEEFEEFEEAEEIELTPESAALYRRVCWKFVVNVKCKNYRWPDATVHYTFRDNWGGALTNATMNTRIREAMDEIEAVTAVRFLERTEISQRDFVRFQDSDGCSATVGRQGGRQNVNLSTSCRKFNVVHELLHALGFKHEHTRHDRDDFVTILEQNIRSGKKHNFETSKKAFDVGSYDHDSLMHYPGRAFCKMADGGGCVGDTIQTKPAGISIGQRQYLSGDDIAGINRLYPGPPPEVELVSPDDEVTRQLNVPVRIWARADAPDYVPDCCTFSWTIDGTRISDHRPGPTRDAELERTFTREGSHRIRVTARTGPGAEASTSVTVNVVNTPPTVAITNPAEGAEVFRDAPVLLRGTSFDPNEAGTELDCTRLEWTSSEPADPLPAEGCELEIAFPSNGTRTLTLTGTDAQDAAGTASVTFSVVDPPENLPPTVQILSPENGVTTGPDDTLSLEGVASDPEGGEPLGFTWRVSYDSAGSTHTDTIGEEASLQWAPSDTIAFSSCDVNQEARLDLSVTDPDGNTGSDFIMIRIQRIC